jgi:hypothetical protein
MSLRAGRNGGSSAAAAFCRFAAIDVLFQCYRFQVVGVDAASISTQVIELKAFWDCAHNPFPQRSMCKARCGGLVLN